MALRRSTLPLVLPALFGFLFSLAPPLLQNAAAANMDPACKAAFSYQGQDLRARIRLYTKCLNSDKLTTANRVAIYTNRGLGYSDLGQYDRALADFDRAIELAPSDASLYHNKANSYERSGRYGLAIENYNLAIKLAPGYAAPYNNLAFLLATCKDPKYRNGRRAVQLGLKAVGLSRNTPAHWDTLAAAYAELGQFSKAIEAQSKAILIARSRGNPTAARELRKPLRNYEFRKKYY